MTWVKLDDRFPDNTKVEDLSDRAFRRYVEGLCFCARNLTDGRLTTRALAKLATRIKERDELVDAGLWESEPDGSVVVHDYLKYNPSRSKVEAERDSARGRMKKHRSGEHNTEHPPEQPDEPDPEQGPEQNGEPKFERTAEVLVSRPRASGRDPTDPLFVSNSGKNLSERDPDPDPTCQDSPSARAHQAQAVFEHWQVIHNHKTAKLDRKRKARIEARLREGFTVDRLCRAISNAKNDRFLMGENDVGRVYDCIHTLLRDAAQVERLEALTERPSGTQRSAGKPPGAAAHETRTAERSMDTPPAFRPAGELKPISADFAALAQQAAAAARGGT